jgi:hypothetical protein
LPLAALTTAERGWSTIALAATLTGVAALVAFLLENGTDRLIGHTKAPMSRATS